MFTYFSLLSHINEMLVDVGKVIVVVVVVVVVIDFVVVIDVTTTNNSCEYWSTGCVAVSVVSIDDK